MGALGGVDQPIIVLVEPQLAENIGSAARVMLNFGLDRLRLVNPKPEWPSERAKAMASGADRVLEAAVVCRSLKEAIDDVQVVYGTSGRNRDLVKRVITPEQAAVEVRRHMVAGVRTAILFGPERTGLVNDDVAIVDATITVPVNPAFASLNLAQAVAIVGYEWMKAGDATPPEELRHNLSPLASKLQLGAFLNRLEAELDLCGFLRVPHMRPTMVRNLRAIFSRASLTDQEVRTLHGVLTELVTRRVDGRPVVDEPPDGNAG